MSENSDRSAASRMGLSPRVAEAVAAALRKRILRSEVDGVPLPRQDDLMKQFGVSGPSLREALRILETEGLITVRRGKLGGAYVHKPSWSSAAYALGLSLQGQGVTIADLAASLLTLEPMGAADCASRPDREREIVPALRTNLDDTELLLGDGARYSASARTFHDILVTGMKNDTMRLLVRSMVAIWSIQEQIWAEGANATSQYPDLEHQRESFRTHATMLKYIEAGDAASVSSLATAHLKATQAIVLERFGNETVDASSLLAVQAFRSL